MKGRFLKGELFLMFYVLKKFKKSSAFLRAGMLSVGSRFDLSSLKQTLPTNQNMSRVVLNRLVLCHILDVGTKRSFILLMRKGETTCCAP